MSEMIKKYIVDGNESEVFAISLVDLPAIESDWVALAKEKKQEIMLKDEKKHMLYGCVLRADFPIYRYNPTYGEYFLQFGKEAIEQMQKRFMKDSLLQSFTVNHEEDANGIYITESWIKLSENDKSTALGIGEDCAPGSWFIGAYIDSNDIWQKVQSGEWNGFSIEGLISLAEQEIFSKQTPKEEKLEEVAPTPEPSPAVETPAEPVVEQPSPNEPPPVPTEEVKPEPVVEEAPKVEQPKQDNDVAELIKSLKAEIDALKDLNHNLVDKVKNLSSQPSAKPVNVNAGNGSSNNYTAWRQQMKNMLR